MLAVYLFFHCWILIAKKSSAIPPVLDDGGTPTSSSVSASNDKDGLPIIQYTETGNHNPLFVFTVTIGKKESHVFTYVDDIQDDGSLLVKLSGRNVHK